MTISVPSSILQSAQRAFPFGAPILELEQISLRFGGVQALTNISFNVLEHEIRAIIGPNGAGKSSMLNVINGIYTPQQGSIAVRGEHLAEMTPTRAAEIGMARTFQNIALFRGMSVLDNIMAGRNLHMHATFMEVALQLPRARREETENRAVVEEIIEFLEIEHIRKVPVSRLPYGLQKRVELGRALAAEPTILLLDEPMAGMNHRGEAGHVPLHPRRQRPLRHHGGADRARHGRGDGHLRPRRRARLRQEDRRRHARRGAVQPGRHRRLSRRGTLRGGDG
jgi:branched-chain amino acid transport system ATP-binding protein